MLMESHDIQIDVMNSQLCTKEREKSVWELTKGPKHAVARRVCSPARHGHLHARGVSRTHLGDVLEFWRKYRLD